MTPLQTNSATEGDHPTAEKPVGSRQAQLRQPNKPTAAGFTLIELLVVIAIVGILTAVLLPTLARGKSMARKVVCIGNLKTWAISQQTYANDNEDRIARESITRSATRESWAQVQGGGAIDVWYNALPRHLGNMKASDYALPSSRSRFYERGQLFHCPEARFPAAPGKLHPVFFSLGMNSKLITFGRGTIRFDEIRHTPSTVMFTEGRLEDEAKVDPAQPDDSSGQPSVFANRFVTRHEGLGNIAFADGHVDSKRGREVVRDGWAIFPQNEIIWTIDPQWNPNLTP
ncbi:MAG: prepilin-type N-terminal cleavage/methylation domain-containing protein [Verrucomicrobiales bacterium]|nr:prepilin-type N-terminal cleavage/methylation domain-containing protein [Verrucomicrobiales bacterium]